MNRVTKGFFVWFISLIVIRAIFCIFYPFGTQMPLFWQWFILIVSVYCAIRFSGPKKSKGKSKPALTLVPSEKKPTHKQSKKKQSITPEYIMDRIDSMDGHVFEEFVAELLRDLGYERVKVTPGSGDQGVDVIAVKNGKKYAIQCKRYSKKLGNAAVQQANAGKTIYGCNVAAVITNNYFTDGGKEAAQALGVLLWDRDELMKMITYASFKAGID